jgi:TPP-dependent pyruvate/acetoin dehydrogenase alpha subunit
LETYRQKLLAVDLLTEKGIRELSAQITAEIVDALAFARQSPEPRGLTHFVYADQP